jgi:hypothetical protein
MSPNQTSGISISTALEYLEKVEIGLAELYDWLQNLYDGDEEARLLFRQLKSTENSHATLLAFQKRVVMREHRSFSPVDIDLSPIKQSLALIDKIRAADPPPELDEMIRLLLELDEFTCDRCYRDAIIQANPAIAGLINSMTSDDQKNSVSIREFAQVRGLQVA